MIMNSQGASAIAIALNKYGVDLLNNFNDKHRTHFKCLFGLRKDRAADASLNTYNHVITVNLPGDGFDNMTEFKIEAYKLLIGHLLSHHIYANMRVGTIKEIQTTLGNGSAILQACCIETAADIHSAQLYKEITGKKPSDRVLKEYEKLITVPNIQDTGKYALECIKGGQLPSFCRIILMKKYTSFKSNNYEPIDDIAKMINIICKETLGKQFQYRDIKISLEASFRIINFPNRPNRLR